jgi:N-acetylmuramoyl-L-alanine amidase
MIEDRRPKTEDRRPKIEFENLSSVFRHLSSVFCLLFLTSCATVSYQGQSSVRPRSTDKLIDINEFCQRHGFQYEFDTLDDIVSISSSDKEIKLILNSCIGCFNGRTFSLKTVPVYSRGIIYLPQEVENIVSSKKIFSLQPSYNIKTIVIDPGHGGKDPGAVSRANLKEKDINLGISKYLKEELGKRGFKVVLTRSQDIYLSLEERVAVSKRCNADIFVSIHANSNRARYIKGVEFYYLSPSKFDSGERALRLAKGSDPWPRRLPADVKAILWDLQLTKNYSLSVEFVNKLYFTFKNLGFSVRAPKKASFFVLKSAYVPAVLVETGYLSNKHEEKMLKRKSYQKQIAEAVALSIVSLNQQYRSFVKK